MNTGAESDIEVENTQLDPIRNANIDFGDYNGDGLVDILYTGTVTGAGEVTKLVEFDPESQSYIESNFDLSDIVNASIAFGDVDGDNDLDFTIAGESVSNNNQSLIKTYLNVTNESADVIAGSGNMNGDFESKNMLNDDEPLFVVNNRPSTPSGLVYEMSTLSFILNSFNAEPLAGFNPPLPELLESESWKAIPSPPRS